MNVRHDLNSESVAPPEAANKYLSTHSGRARCNIRSNIDSPFLALSFCVAFGSSKDLRERHYTCNVRVNALRPRVLWGVVV